MKSRIEGALMPGLTATATDDQGNVITNGLSETWTAQASLAGVRPFVQLWQKTTGITATASGFTIPVWAAGDMGALTARSGFDTDYVIEFTSSPSGYIHQELVKITRTVPAP